MGTRGDSGAPEDSEHLEDSADSANLRADSVDPRGFWGARGQEAAREDNVDSANLKRKVLWGPGALEEGPETLEGGHEVLEGGPAGGRGRT